MRNALTLLIYRNWISMALFLLFKREARKDEI